MSSLAEVARSQLGAPYVFGAWGDPCTPALRKKYASYNPAHKTPIYNACPRLSAGADSCAGCRYEGMRAFDCRGFTRWCVREATGFDITGGGCTTQYNTAANWTQKGKREDMPDLPCVLFQQNGNKMKHTGLYIGAGRVVDCSTGVVEMALTPAWTHYAIPAGMYTEEQIKNAGGITHMVTVRRGSSGAEVKALQEALNRMGYDCGTADGKFGKKTEAALVKFQADKGLVADGICGAATWAAIDAGADDSPAWDEYSILISDRVQALEDAVKVLQERVAALEGGAHD